MKLLIIPFVFFLTITSYGQSFDTLKVTGPSYVYVDTVYSSMTKIKEFKKRSVLFGVKQVTEEALSTKYNLSEKGDGVGVEICFVGTPSKSFRIAGIGGAEEQTVVRIKIYHKGNVYDGEGISQVDVTSIFVELADDLPFSQTVLSTAIKKAILDAVGKMQ